MCVCLRVWFSVYACVRFENECVWVGCRGEEFMCACKWMREYVCGWAIFFWNEWMFVCLMMCVWCACGHRYIYIFMCFIFLSTLYVPATRRDSYTCFSLRSRALTLILTLNTLSLETAFSCLIRSVRFVISFSVEDSQLTVDQVFASRYRHLTFVCIYCNKVIKYVRASIVPCTFDVALAE